MRKKNKTNLIFVNIFCTAALVVICLCMFAFFKYSSGAGQASANSDVSRTKVIYGIGYVRGKGQITLRNKFAGYVSKVYFFSQERVKKGDVILEYDDLDLRTKISELRHDITEQEKELEKAKLELALTQIDPLPSDYRNLEWKHRAAKEKFRRYKHEQDVYDKLYRNRIVSELAYREKTQETVDAEAELKRYNSDMERINSGIEKLNVELAQKSVETSALKLKNLQEELKLLLEQQKYYKITAPFDGLCITNSDTVHGYDTAGAAAAVIHADRQKIIYAYFDEKDVGYITEGKPCRFRSNQYPESEAIYTVTPYEVKKDRSSYGDRCFFLVKFTLDDEPKPLRIESTGQVEVTL